MALYCKNCAQEIVVLDRLPPWCGKCGADLKPEEFLPEAASQGKGPDLSWSPAGAAGATYASGGWSMPTTLGSNHRFWGRSLLIWVVALCFILIGVFLLVAPSLE